VHYKPVRLGDIIVATGGVPLVRRHPARQDYRLVEMQRWAQKRGLFFDLHLKHFPADPTLADGIVLAALSVGLDPTGFIRLALSGRWEQQLDLSDMATLTGLADTAGLPGQHLFELALSPSVAAAYEANTRAAISVGVFGSPTYVLDGELFWGQDRIEFLAEAITSGRPPFLPNH
jgi:2-hydroxychromene-2-carboxylate isomerase